jgi:hypothetical protein
MKNAVFWDVTPCGSCKNRRSSETSVLTRATRRIRFLVTANVVPRSPILVTLIIRVIRSSGTLVLTRAKRRNIPEYGIFFS